MILPTGKCRAENELTANKGKVAVMQNIEIPHQPRTKCLLSVYIPTTYLAMYKNKNLARPMCLSG